MEASCASSRVEALAALGEPLAVLEISMKCERCSRWVRVPEGTTQDECQRNCPVYPPKPDERKNVMVVPNGKDEWPYVCETCGQIAKVEYEDRPDTDKWSCPNCGPLEWKLCFSHNTATQRLFPVKAPKKSEGVTQQVLTHGDGYRDFKVIEKVEPKPAKKKLSVVPYVVAFCASLLFMALLRRGMDFNVGWVITTFITVNLRYAWASSKVNAQ